MVTISTTRGAKQKLMLAKLLFDASHAPPFVAGLLVAMYFQSYYLGYRRPYNMSSRDLENLSLSVRPAPERLLMLLKTRGPQTAADLGAKLTITGEAARQLLKLAGEGLVEATAESRGVGRPSQVWRLTA